MWRSLLFLLCGLPVICFAQLTGEFQFHFTNNLPLWDFTGSYADNDATIQSEAILAHAPSGNVTGSGSVHYQDGFTRFDATQTSKGRVTGSSRTSVTVNVAGSGQFSGTSLGRAISGPFDGSIALTLDPTNRTVSGRESATLCVRGVGCRTVSTNVSFELPAQMDGTWSLTLNITTSGNAVRGTAVALLSNGRTVSFNARGRFRAATGLTRLNLAGRQDALGVNIPLQLNAAGAIEKLGGKIFGQRLVYP